MPEGGLEAELRAAKRTNDDEENMFSDSVEKLYPVKPNMNVTLSLLLRADHCQWVTGHLSSGKGHETEEKQFGVTVVGWIALRPVHNRLQHKENVYSHNLSDEIGF